MNTGRVLISGASIAGPALAYWLAHIGWDVTVVERAPKLRTSGYPVDVRGVAVEALKRTGLYDDVAAARYRHVPIEVLSPSGRTITRLNLGASIATANQDDVEITRGALTEILYAASKGRATYVFGDSIRSIEQGENGVDVTFDQRRPATYDAVIGADGIHSNTRTLLRGADSNAVRHLGSYGAIWDAPGDLVKPNTGYLYSHPGRTVEVERAGDGPTRILLVFQHPRPGSVDRRDRVAIERTIRGAFAEDVWRTSEIIDTIEQADDVYFDTVSQVRVDRWSVGRVGLVGDSAYAPSFLSGQGTSIALTGAYILAGEFARHDDPATAFASYERILRPYITTNQDLALKQRLTVLSHDERELRRRNRRLQVTSCLARFGIDRLLRKDLRSASNALSLPAYGPRISTVADTAGSDARHR